MARKTKRPAPPKERNPIAEIARFRSGAGSHKKPHKVNRSVDKQRLRREARELPQLAA